jgi:hypothetical protein
VPDPILVPPGAPGTEQVNTGEYYLNDPVYGLPVDALANGDYVMSAVRYPGQYGTTPVLHILRRVDTFDPSTTWQRFLWDSGGGSYTLDDWGHVAMPPGTVGSIGQVLTKTGDYPNSYQWQ